MEVIDTGERILLDKETPFTIVRHFCAYKFAGNYAQGKKILDFGCGEGYGSNYLASFAKKVTALDRDQAVIDYAKSKYKKENLVFLVLDADRLNSINERFDLICSFQVIEHIQDADKLLKDVANLLSNDGIFICSTPNRLDSSPHRAVPLNRFHIKEYSACEFENMLKQCFSGIEIFGLKRGRALNFYRRLKKIGIFNFLPGTFNPVQRFYRNIGPDNFTIAKGKLDTALDFITICKK